MGKKNLTRRQFITVVGIGAGSVLAGTRASSTAAGKKFSGTDPFQIVTLGNTGIKTTLLGMGTGYSGYNRSSAITRAGIAESLIKYAWDKGMRYFDCADSYGTHPFLAGALKGIPRESYTLGTKIWVSPGGIPEEDHTNADISVERFRRELNTDYLDIVQIHCMTSGGWTDEQKKQMDILYNLKSKGIIKAHGVSVHSFEALEAAAASPWVDVIHVRINPYGANMDLKDPAKITPVIEKMHKAGKGIIGMKLVGGGNFNNDPEKIEQSLKFVLGLGTVDMIIIGFEMPEQVDNYIARLESALLELNA